MICSFPERLCAYTPPVAARSNMYCGDIYVHSCALILRIVGSTSG
jgi:hypothetical protein